LVTSLTKG